MPRPTVAAAGFVVCLLLTAPASTYSDTIGHGPAQALTNLLTTAHHGHHHRVAVLYVAHGEPATFADGLVPRFFWDGTAMGPAGVSLGVPAEEQSTIWAAGYEEIAQAMSYEYPCATSGLEGDFNCNGIRHELRLFPMGDVPPFFAYPAFKGMSAAEYAAIGGSPHNAAWEAHVAGTSDSLGRHVDAYLAFLDAAPFVADEVHEIAAGGYDTLVVVPLLMSESTHTQEITDEVAVWLAKEGRRLELVSGQPFFGQPFVRDLHAGAVADLARFVRERVPAEASDAEIGVVLAVHGDPFKPPYAEFGWAEGDVYSKLLLTEGDFGKAVAAQLPWQTVVAAMEFRPPTVDTMIAQMEASGKKHIIVVPAVFPTAAIHTMWDIPMKAIGRPLTVQEGVGSRPLASGTTVWCTSLGYGDIPAGAEKIRTGMRFEVEVGLMQVVETRPHHDAP